VLFVAVLQYCTLAVVVVRSCRNRPTVGECCVVNGSLNACTLYPYKIVGTCILFISLCLLGSSTLSSLDMLKVFQGDIKRVTREVDIQMPADQP